MLHLGTKDVADGGSFGIISDDYKTCFAHVIFTTEATSAEWNNRRRPKKIVNIAQLGEGFKMSLKSTDAGYQVHVSSPTSYHRTLMLGRRKTEIGQVGKLFVTKSKGKLWLLTDSHVLEFKSSEYECAAGVDFISTIRETLALKAIPSRCESPQSQLAGDVESDHSDTQLTPPPQKRRKEQLDVPPSKKCHPAPKAKKNGEEELSRVADTSESEDEMNSDERAIEQITQSSQSSSEKRKSNEEDSLDDTDFASSDNAEVPEKAGTVSHKSNCVPILTRLPGKLTTKMAVDSMCKKMQELEQAQKTFTRKKFPLSLVKPSNWMRELQPNSVKPIIQNFLNGSIIPSEVTVVGFQDGSLIRVLDGQRTVEALQQINQRRKSDNKAAFAESIWVKLCQSETEFDRWCAALLAVKRSLGPKKYSTSEKIDHVQRVCEVAGISVHSVSQLSKGQVAEVFFIYLDPEDFPVPLIRVACLGGHTEVIQECLQVVEDRLSKKKARTLAPSFVDTVLASYRKNRFRTIEVLEDMCDRELGIIEVRKALRAIPHSLCQTLRQKGYNSQEIEQIRKATGDNDLVAKIASSLHCSRGRLTVNTFIAKCMKGVEESEKTSDNLRLPRCISKLDRLVESPFIIIESQFYAEVENQLGFSHDCFMVVLGPIESIWAALEQHNPIFHSLAFPPDCTNSTKSGCLGVGFIPFHLICRIDGVYLNEEAVADTIVKLKCSDITTLCTPLRFAQFLRKWGITSMTAVATASYKDIVVSMSSQMENVILHTAGYDFSADIHIDEEDEMEEDER